MGLLHWIVEHAEVVYGSSALTVGLIFDGWGHFAHAKEVRQANQHTIIAHHREIVKDIRSDPYLKRVLDPDADGSTLSIQEIHGVNPLFLHLYSNFRASKARLYRMPQHIDADLRFTLNLPVPAAVWEKLKGYYDDDFVAYVDGIVNGKKR
jgi:hypothetical protein